MRSFDHRATDRELGFHKFIKVKEWNLGDTRRYFYNGHEVVDKEYDGKPYKAVRVFLLDEFSKEELTLEINGITYSESFRAAKPGQFDLVEVTKTEKSFTKKNGETGTGITYTVKIDPKTKLKDVEKAALEVVEPVAVPTKKPDLSEEIDISDIPF